MDKEQMKELSKCDGKHKTLDELFKCKSCSVLFKNEQIKERLEYLRGELREGCMSYGELAELQSLAEHIEPGDVELLEAAGVPEKL